MSNYKINVTDEAKKDIIEIYNYIKIELMSPENAERQYKRIENAIRELDFMPERHRLYDKEPWKSRGLRIFSIDNFIVVYYINENLKTVNISNVFYGKRNIDEILNK